MSILATPPFRPFYLPAAGGERLCVYYPAAGRPQGGLVYVHPFAEEMNKARRLAAAQSRMLAVQGYAVLHIDLFGCGDSSGDFGHARWEIWKEDLALAVHWLRRRVSDAVYLWGLRLGALLAIDYGADCRETVGGFVLWQPVVSGGAFLTQFLRMKVASGLTSGGQNITTEQLRAQLKSGATLEVGGYELGPALAHAIDGLKLVNFHPLAPVYWLDVVPDDDAVLPPASRRAIDTWVSGGLAVDAIAVSGEQFWHSIETTDCPRLLEETLRMLCGVLA